MMNQKRHSQDHFSPVIEYLVIGVILLVIIHTMVEEFAILFRWSHTNINYIVIAGFFFDLFFTVEFIARSIVTGRRQGFKRYFFSERGWIDLLSSVPLLLLVSGPSLFMIAMGMESESATLEFLHILKTAKAVRVTRILRLIRVVKLFGKIQNTESAMTNRHVGAISTIGVIALIITLGFHHLIPGVRIGDHGDYIKQRLEEITPMFKMIPAGTASENVIVNLLKSDPRNGDVIRVKNKHGESIYENPDAHQLHFTSFHDREIPLDGGYTIALSYHPAEMDNARVNLLILFGVLVVITGYILFYTRIFAQQIADPIFVMDKGIRRWDYNLEVKIHEHFENEEIFMLAQAYNARWLPLKNRLRRGMKSRNQEKSVLKMDDFNFT